VKVLRQKSPYSEEVCQGFRTETDLCCLYISCWRWSIILWMKLLCYKLIFSVVWF